MGPCVCTSASVTPSPLTRCRMMSGLGEAALGNVSFALGQPGLQDDARAALQVEAQSRTVLSVRNITAYIAAILPPGRRASGRGGVPRFGCWATVSVSSLVRAGAPRCAGPECRFARWVRDGRDACPGWLSGAGSGVVASGIDSMSGTGSITRAAAARAEQRTLKRGTAISAPPCRPPRRRRSRRPRRHHLLAHRDRPLLAADHRCPAGAGRAG